MALVALAGTGSFNPSHLVLFWNMDCNVPIKSRLPWTAKLLPAIISRSTSLIPWTKSAADTDELPTLERST
jgi:hypothetical protein